MGVTAHLIFDPTGVVAEQSNVGAWTLAGDTGNQISSKSIATVNWLNVAAATFDGAGTAITSTTSGAKQGLDVNVISNIDLAIDGVYNAGTNPDPANIGLIVGTRAASLDDTTQTFRTSGGQPTSDAVTAANVWAQDVAAFSMGFNGTSWDRLQVSASKNLKVDIAESTATVTVTDAALANTAITNNNTSVGTTIVSTVATPLTNRKYLFYANNSKNAVYIGTTGLTTANGYPLFAGQQISLRAGQSIDVKAIASVAASDTRYLELS